ncbi:type II toxin-antitoxin system RelE/ParE family toxin [Hyphomonas sp.]|uniref:type II toxin-antitoxin system RelE/ParE family toxin n=1 Tax=Hyphomonas sp. TaxID=87 RepID=UPI00391D311E
MDKMYTVGESLAAQADYDRIDDFLFEMTGDSALASRVVMELSGFVGRLSRLPHQGTRRDDILPGLRVLPLGKAVIAFTVDDEARTVFVLRLFYGGEDIMTALGKIDLT